RFSAPRLTDCLPRRRPKTYCRYSDVPGRFFFMPRGLPDGCGGRKKAGMWKAMQAGPVLAAQSASGVTAAPPASAPTAAPPRPRTAEDEWIDLVRTRALAGTPEFDKYAPGDAALSAEVKDAPANFLFAAEDDPHD